MLSFDGEGRYSDYHNCINWRYCFPCFFTPRPSAKIFWLPSFRNAVPRVSRRTRMVGCGRSSNASQDAWAAGTPFRRVSSRVAHGITRRLGAAHSRRLAAAVRRRAVLFSGAVGHRRQPTPPGRLRLEIYPGMACGTGRHPATQLCLQAIERYVRPGARVLDVGSGSGILSDAARLMGAASVIGCDIDPDGRSNRPRTRPRPDVCGIGGSRAIPMGGRDRRQHRRRYAGNHRAGARARAQVPSPR